LDQTEHDHRLVRDGAAAADAEVMEKLASVHRGGSGAALYGRGC
jgi:hypothetical protein